MPGKVISHYRILEKLNSGGMGVVYKAEDIRLKRTVALKFLPEDFTIRTSDKERFITEAQLASSLQHHNVCTIHEISETPEGQLYICMDYYEGETLKSKLSHTQLDIDTILDIAGQITEGIIKAHQAGIIHRDLKPENIMITQEGTVKILDFGISRITGNKKITHEGKTSGTINYLSPEQAQGLEADQQTDIWALGIILYELCTGQLPFNNEYEAAIIYSILDKIPESPSEFRTNIPIKLEEVIFKCLKKEKSERYRNAEQLLAEISKVRLSIKGRDISEQNKRADKRRGTERRLVTIVCTEMESGNLLKNADDSEEIATFLRSLFELHNQVAWQYNGILRKLSPYNFMVTIGFPNASEQSPRQAINLAINLRNRITMLVADRMLPGSLLLKIGINTGEVIADELIIDGRREYTILGQTVDFATQLKNISTEGRIIAGPATFKYARKDFEFKPVRSGITDVKKEHIIIYELISKRENVYRTSPEAGRMIFSEIVGREIEMDRLLNHLSKLMEGKGFIVSIIGEAGIGKSRLIAELLKKEEITDMRCLEGRALSIGRNLPFHPVIDLLRKFAGISEDDSEIISFNKCEKLVRDIVPGGADEILPFIATLMGLSLTGKYADRLQGIEGEALEKLILKNLRDFFAKAVESKPMIIIIEDLHWADLSSISLLESLYRLATNNKLLFINVLRPGYDETSGRILTTIKNRYPGHHDEINIEPLNLQQTDLLLNNLMKLKKLPPGIDEKIKEKSGGNPFFVEEVVQSMLDEKVIELEHGSLRLSGKAEDIVIPETISELLLTRIDKLDEDSRRLLKNASVIGRNFFYKVLVELSDNSDNSDTDEILENLKRVQLVLERKRMAEVEYLFKHALIQQAVYGTLLAGQKKELHLRVAKAIEKVFPGRLPDFFGTLAFHYTLAEELNKAENYLIKAGEKALRSGASTEAINYYKDALAIYRQKYGRSTDPEKIAMLEKNIATAMFNKGHFIDAAEYFENALAYYGMNVPKKMFPKALKVLRGIMNIVIKLTFTSLMATKTPSREEREIIELIRNRGASLGLTDAKRFVIEIISFFPWYSNFDVRKTDILVFVALMFSFGGISQKFGSRVLNYYGRKYNKNDRAASFMYLTDQFCTSLWTGDWDQMHYDEAVCNQGLLLGNLYNLVTYVGFQGHLLIERGEREAMKYLDRCSEISEMYDYDYGRLAKYTHGTLYLLKFRLLDEALVRSDESISFIQKTIGNRPGLLMTLSLKVRIQLLSGNIADASETMKTTEELASADIYVPYFLTFYTTTRFMVYLYKLQESVITEDKDQIRLIKKDTLNSGKKAVKVCRQAAFERVETYRLMGTYHWITGNRKTALRWWGKSIDEALRLNAKLELSRTYLEAGKRLLEERSQKKIPEASEAGEYLTKARQLFAEMNLQWDNEKLEQISSKNNALKSEMNKDG